MNSVVIDSSFGGVVAALRLSTKKHIVAFYFQTNSYELDEAIYKVIFIGLEYLTFPHILLEYLLEKNEK